MDRLSTSYINSTVYKDLEDKLKNLKSVLDDQTNKLESSRKLRYAEVDIEAEREAGRLLPDELYIPLHIIDTNIRREQSPYVQFITQSARAVILEDLDDTAFSLKTLEVDLTKRLRYDGWQLPMFACIDGFQANGYSVLEVVQEQNNPGELAIECVPYSDFAFTSDTKNIQSVEIIARTYYFTRTELLKFCGDGTQPDDWSRYQVDKIISKDPEANHPAESVDVKDKSLYKVFKFMFRVDGIVNVAWGHPETCDDWVRMPRKLFIGRRKFEQVQQLPMMVGPAPVTPQGQWVEDYETNYPYILFPYLISENDTISQAKGRVFLDQDLQEAVSSLLSSTVTQARRAAGMYFSKDVTDPNDDLLLQKNIFFRSGCIVNSKIQAFDLKAPDPSMFNAINMLISANQNETSQVNFASMNRKDSRKTAKEITVAEREEQSLSTVQVVLFSIALTQLYRLMCSVIKSRVLSGLIEVRPELKELYQRRYSVKPSGGVDVIERQEKIRNMFQAWPVVGQTGAAPAFMADLLEMLFPDRASVYIKAIEQQMQQQQGAQGQMVQTLLGVAKEVQNGIDQLAKHPEFFSEVGKIHALPAVKMGADKLKQIETQLNGR